MNKKELVKVIACQEGLAPSEVDRVLTAFVASVQTELQSGRCVKLQGLGTFEVKNRAARKGRNPLSGASVDVPPKVSPAFRASVILKTMVESQPTH